jgi:hypothetical protein
VLKVKDIKIPIKIEANISNESTFAYSLNGSYKIGYKIDITGLKSKVTPIYENNVVAANPSTSETYGELLTDSKIIITPDISILDGAYTVDGDLTLGNKTTTYGHVAFPGQTPVFGSKGLNTTNLTAYVDLILLKVPVEVINTETVVWNVGTIVKSVVYSDLKYTLGSYKDNTNILSWGIINRAYNTEFALNYKYPVIGKKIPSELIISYDVYEDNGSTKIVSVKDQVIYPSDITANSFKFRQDIPFRGKTTIKIIPPSITTTYQTKVYIKNIVIKDRNDYVYEGIYNSTKSLVENNWEIKK